MLTVLFNGTILACVVGAARDQRTDVRDAAAFLREMSDQGLFNPQVRFDHRQTLEMAHDVVPRVEGLSKEAG